MQFTSSECTIYYFHNLRKKWKEMTVALNKKYIRCALVRKIHFSPTFCTTSISRHKSCGIYECAILSSLFRSIFLHSQAVTKAYFWSSGRCLYDAHSCLRLMSQWNKLAQNIDPVAYLSENPEIESQEYKTGWSETKWGGWYWWELGFQNMTTQHGRV